MPADQDNQEKMSLIVDNDEDKLVELALELGRANMISIQRFLINLLENYKIRTEESPVDDPAPNKLIVIEIMDWGDHIGGEGKVMNCYNLGLNDVETIGSLELAKDFFINRIKKGG